MNRVADSGEMVLLITKGLGGRKQANTSRKLERTKFVYREQKRKESKATLGEGGI